MNDDTSDTYLMVTVAGKWTLLVLKYADDYVPEASVPGSHCVRSVSTSYRTGASTLKVTFGDLSIDCTYQSKLVTRTLASTRFKFLLISSNNAFKHVIPY